MMMDLEKHHRDRIMKVLDETSKELGKITPVIHCTVGSDVFPKVKAAQIGGPDIYMEYVVDKDGNVKYLEPRRRR